jgi:hypothetical protein
MLGFSLAAFDRERAVEPYLVVIVCIVAALVIWGLMRVGAQRPTAGWAWALVFLFSIALVADIVSMRILGTSATPTFFTAPRQKAEGK